MLEETIRDMQGDAPVMRVSAVIDLDVDAYLPSVYIPDEGQRMDMYRRIAAIDSVLVFQDVLDELLDRYGDLPAAVISLAEIALIRSIAEKRRFVRIYEQKPNLVFACADQGQPDMAFLSAMLSLPESKGMLLFNAGTRPHVVYSQGAADRNKITARLRNLFVQAENLLHKHSETAV